ncbi:hypothetical protein H6P81_015464 [Aristolochia fimbriata]|uniref:Uncharacterized protein n=1 Tax=Aristolochia fimbriata TaxID=158543 RepID=A0AAV7E5V6_ARIFI|nr:hypothetical protein H6P81_015464 [Aristolochia fimbriata]
MRVSGGGGVTVSMWVFASETVQIGNREIAKQGKRSRTAAPYQQQSAVRSAIGAGAHGGVNISAKSGTGSATNIPPWSRSETRQSSDRGLAFAYIIELSLRQTFSPLSPSWTPPEETDRRLFTERRRH